MVNHDNPLPEEDLPCNIVLPDDVFDQLLADLDAPPRDVPGLRQLMSQHNNITNT